MEAGERARLIAQYRDGYRDVHEALEGITDEELDRAPDGEWTPRQIAHHLGDAELIGAARIRRLLAEPDAEIRGYDEKVFMERMPGDRPVDASLQAMRWARESTVELLERMSDSDWKRAGRHSERGRFTPEDWLALYARHAHDHAEQIRLARGKQQR